jgi:hypothetical protein
MSDGIKQAKGLQWLRKGIPEPTGTVTVDFNATPARVRLSNRESGQGRLHDWLGGDRVYRIAEEVVGLGSYGRTLAVLTSGQLSTDRDLVEDYEDDEEKLVKSWTPRFRR